MERYFNMKYVLYEAKRNLKWILLISIVLALLFTAYSYINIQKQRGNQRYGAYCELYVEYGQSNDIYLINDKNIDISSFTLPVVKSDAFFKSLSEDSEIKEKGITEDDLKTMIYPISKSGGTVIKISTAVPDSETAELLCKKAMQNAWDLYASRGFEVSAQHETEALGPVVIETKDDPDNAYETISYVIKTDEVLVSPKALLQKGIIGFVFGIIASWICIIGIFVFSDKIIYSDQIGENLGMKVLGSSQNDDCFQELYSNFIMNDLVENKLCFLALQKTDDCSGSFIKSFAEFMGDKGKNVLLLEPAVDDMDEELSIDDKGKFCFAGLDIRTLYDTDALNNIFDRLNSKFDYILINNGDVKKSPMGKVLWKYADAAVLAIKSNSNTIKELQMIKEKFEATGIPVIGCVFID